jgi:hypothetical protein
MSEERRDCKQNTNYFSKSKSKAEEAKLLKQVIEMLHYLPDVLE